MILNLSVAFFISIYKKVITKNNEASLILSSEMTINQELIEYLTYVLEISEEKIPTIVRLFNDYTSKVEMG